MTHSRLHVVPVDPTLPASVRSALLDGMSSLVDPRALDARLEAIDWATLAAPATAAGHTSAVPAPPRSARGAARRGSSGRVALRLVLAAFIVFAGTGVAAAAGLLPGPIAHQVSRVARVVGITQHHDARPTEHARTAPAPPVSGAAPSPAVVVPPRVVSPVRRHVVRDRTHGGEAHDLARDEPVDGEARHAPPRDQGSSSSDDAQHAPESTSTDGESTAATAPEPPEGQDSAGSGTNGSDESDSSGDAHGG